MSNTEKQTSTARIKAALDIATPGRSKFSCWAGPTGAGIVEITKQDLHDLLARNARLRKALRGWLDACENGSHTDINEAREQARAALNEKE